MHVTNNLSDEYDKPKVVIAIVNKAILKKRVETFTRTMLSLILEPVVFRPKQKMPKRGSYQQTAFLSFDDLEKASMKQDYRSGFYQTLKEHFPQKKGKGRYRMMPSLPKGLKKWAKSNWSRHVIREQLKPLHLSREGKSQAGYLRSISYSGAAILHNSTVYRIREHITPRQLTEAFLGVSVVAQLLQHIKAAIVITNGAQTYSETENVIQPVRLFESN